MWLLKEHEYTEYINIINFYLNNFDNPQKEIQLLCRKICDEIILKYILSVLSTEEHQSIWGPRLDQLFIDFYTTEKEYDFFNSVKTNVENHMVSLKDNGFLAFPWKKRGLVDIFHQFGKSDFCWQQDANHSITLVKPFNIYFVNGGNHSIACGKFFDKSGVLECDSAIDYSNILKKYHFNGEYYLNDERKKINKPFHKELTVLFLLGKILIEIN